MRFPSFTGAKPILGFIYRFFDEMRISNSAKD